MNKIVVAIFASAVIAASYFIVMMVRDTVVCADRGGIAIRGLTGLVCVRSDAVIDVRADP